MHRIQRMKRVITMFTAMAVMITSLGMNTLAEDVHEHVSGEVTVENFILPDCTTPGTHDAVTYCVTCGAELSRETITDQEAAGHTPGAAVSENVVPATCTTPGSHDVVTYCTTCGVQLTRETVQDPLIAHTWNEGKVTTEPTKYAEGIKTFTCTSCGVTRTEAVPKLPAVKVTFSGEAQGMKVSVAVNASETPVSAEADGTWLLEPGDYTYSAEAEGYEKVEKVSFTVAGDPVTVDVKLLPNAGTCGIYGENLKWELDKEGKLTITGTGEMMDYQEVEIGTVAPWDLRRDDIKTIEIAEGITKIGNYAFRGCTKLESITIPASVTSIGEHAFDECSALKTATYGGSDEQWDAIQYASAIQAEAGTEEVAATEAVNAELSEVAVANVADAETEDMIAAGDANTTTGEEAEAVNVEPSEDDAPETADAGPEEAADADEEEDQVAALDAETEEPVAVNAAPADNDEAEPETEPEEDEAVPVETWDQLAAAISDAEDTVSIKLTDNLEASDQGISLQGDQTVVIDLNGKTIDLKTLATGFTLGSGSVLELTDTGSDGKLTGGNGASVSIDGGDFRMTGGSITQNQQTGVSASDGSFTMTGGTISGNQRGVDVSDADIHLGGDLSIIDNTENVFLSSSKKIHIIEELSSTAKIGVTMEDQAGVFTQSLKEACPDLEDPSAIFSSDEGQSLEWDADGKEARIVIYHEVTVEALPADYGTTAGAGTYQDGDTVNLTAEPKEGYHFVSWTEDGAEVSSDAQYSFPVETDHSLTANFAADTDTEYRVYRYYQENGTYPENSTVYVKHTGETGTEAVASRADKTPPKAKQDDYIFDEENDLNVLTGTIAGDGSLRLKVYFKQQFTVSYDPGDHGTFTAGEEGKTEFASLTYQAATPAYAGETDDNGNPTGESGYTFAGWDQEIAGNVTQTVTYTAQWKADVTYTLTEGAGQKYTQGTAGTLTFVIKRSEADETSIDHFQKLRVDGKLLKRDTHYTAEAGSVVITLQNSFLKSLKTGNRTLQVVFDDGEVSVPFQVVENTTTYTVTFDANGHGTAPSAQTVTEGSRASRPTNPTADGYSFGGWYTEAECENAFSFSTAITQDITLFAKWTARSTSSSSSGTNTSGGTNSSGSSSGSSSGRSAPSTGDPNHTVLWAVLLALSLLATCGAGMVLYRKKRTK